MGFSFGNHEDSPQISIIEKVLKNAGIFLTKRND
jgi:hypothetical protein